MAKNDLDILTSSALFDDLPVAALEDLVPASDHRSFAKDELLLGQQQTGRYDVYAILRGRIAAF